MRISFRSLATFTLEVSEGPSVTQVLWHSGQRNPEISLESTCRGKQVSIGRADTAIDCISICLDTNTWRNGEIHKSTSTGCNKGHSSKEILSWP